MALRNLPAALLVTLSLLAFPGAYCDTDQEGKSGGTAATQGQWSVKERPKTVKKILQLHKPMPSPSWGKVLQYRRESPSSTGDKNGETLHEFLFQDDAGIIRTALYHEPASGEGYWEVWIWDQP